MRPHAQYAYYFPGACKVTDKVVERWRVLQGIALQNFKQFFCLRLQACCLQLLGILQRLLRAGEFSSPGQPLGALGQRLGHGISDRLSHARFGYQEHRFLNRLPIFFRDKHGRTSLACDDDGLMRLSRLVNEAVEVGSGFACGEYGQARSPSESVDGTEKPYEQSRRVF